MDSMTKQVVGNFGINLVINNFGKFMDTLHTGGAAWGKFGKDILAQTKEMAVGFLLFPKFQKGILGMSVAVTAAGAAMKGLAVSATVLYARTAVLNTVLITVGRNAGYTATKIVDIRNSVVKLGITTQDASQAIIKLAQNEVKLADAVNLAKSAQDLAVISGENSSEAYSTLIDSIGSLSPMLLRQYGLTKTLTDIEEMYARKLNKSATALTEIEIKQAMVNYILLEGRKAAGNYIAAMDDAGKQVASFTRLLNEIYNEIGKEGLKVYQPVITLIYDVLNGLTKMDPWLKTAASSFLVFCGAVMMCVAPLTFLTLNLVSWGGLISMYTMYGKAAVGATKALGGALLDLVKNSAVLRPLLVAVTEAAAKEGLVFGGSVAPTTAKAGALVLAAKATQALTVAIGFNLAVASHEPEKALATSVAVMEECRAKKFLMEQNYTLAVASGTLTPAQHLEWIALKRATLAAEKDVAAKTLLIAETKAAALAATEEAAALAAQATAAELAAGTTAKAATAQQALNAAMVAGMKAGWASFKAFIASSIASIRTFTGVLWEATFASKAFTVSLGLFGLLIAGITAAVLCIRDWDKENERRIEMLKAEEAQTQNVLAINRRYLDTVLAITRATTANSTVMGGRLSMLRQMGITYDQLDADGKTLLATETKLREKNELLNSVRATAIEQAAQLIKDRKAQGFWDSKEMQDSMKKHQLEVAIHAARKKLGLDDLQSFNLEHENIIKAITETERKRKAVISLKEASKALEQEMLRLKESVDFASSAYEFGAISADQLAAVYVKVEKTARELYNVNAMETSKLMSDIIATDSAKKKSIQEHMSYDRAKFADQRELGLRSTRDEANMQKKHADYMRSEDIEYQKKKVERQEVLTKKIAQQQLAVDAAMKVNKEAKLEEDKFISAYNLKIAEAEMGRIQELYKNNLTARLHQDKEQQAEDRKTAILKRQADLEDIGRERQRLDQRRQLNLISLKDYDAKLKAQEALELTYSGGDPNKKLQNQLNEEQRIRNERDLNVQRNLEAANRFMEASDKGSFDKRLLKQAEFIKGQKLNIDGYLIHYKGVLDKEYEVTDGARRREFQMELKFGAERAALNQKIAATYTITSIGTIAKNEFAYRAYTKARLDLDKKMYDYEFEKGKEQLNNDIKRISQQTDALTAQLKALTDTEGENGKQYASLMEKIMAKDKEVDSNKDKGRAKQLAAEKLALDTELKNLSGGNAEKVRQYQSLMDQIKAKNKEEYLDKKKLDEMAEQRQNKMQQDRLSFEDKMANFVYEKTHTAAEAAKRTLFVEVSKYINEAGGQLKDTMDYMRLMLKDIDGAAQKAGDSLEDGFDRGAKSADRMSDSAEDANKWFKTISDFSTVGSFGTAPKFGTDADKMGPVLGDTQPGALGPGQKQGWGMGPAANSGFGLGPAGPKGAPETAEGFWKTNNDLADKQLKALIKIKQNTTPKAESGAAASLMGGAAAASAASYGFVAATNTEDRLKVG